MYFIINTAVGDHFCALFDDDQTLVAQHAWEMSRRDGAEVFAFLTEQQFQAKDITFIGGVTGPGGFTSLRVSSSILNALSFKHNLPIHQISAVEWTQKILGQDNFVLNCFGNTVWVLAASVADLEGPDSERLNTQIQPKKSLKKITTEAAVEFFGDTKVFAQFLPEPKKQKFFNQDVITTSVLTKNLLEALIDSEPNDYFKAFYNVSPVG
jgi:tRNA A37 threonylcarbamoyladenosine modification protein TsaB